MKKSNIFCVLIILIICCERKSKRTSPQNNVVKEIVETKAEFTSHQSRQSIIEGTIGIITTNDNYQFGDTINIFDKKEKIQSHIVITEEYQILSLKCLSKDNSFYEVIYENGKKSFVSKNEKNVIFQTWEEHVLSVFSVGFDEAKNPLLKSPSKSSEKVYYDKDEFYHPSKIKGDWLQVKWGSKDNWGYGWIKWKDGEKLLIELYYFA